MRASTHGGKNPVRYILTPTQRRVNYQSFSGYGNLMAAAAYIPLEEGRIL